MIDYSLFIFVESLHENITNLLVKHIVVGMILEIEQELIVNVPFRKGGNNFLVI